MRRITITIAAVMCFAASACWGAYVKGIYVRDAASYKQLRISFAQEQETSGGEEKMAGRSGKDSIAEDEETAGGDDVYAKASWLQNIDFKGLGRINEDVAAWVALPGTPISYPVLYSADRTFYLHRNMYRQYSYSGSIFIDSYNTPDFSDPHMILYGHNMRDGSMFAGLNVLYENADAGDATHIIAAVPGRLFFYRIFSIHKAVPEGDTYRVRFKNDDDFNVWKREMQKRNEVGTPGEKIAASGPVDGKPVITLSTCAGDDSDERLVVQGVLEKTLTVNSGKGI